MRISDWSSDVCSSDLWTCQRERRSGWNEYLEIRTQIGDAAQPGRVHGEPVANQRMRQPQVTLHIGARLLVEHIDNGRLAADAYTQFRRHRSGRIDRPPAYRQLTILQR